MFIKYSSCTKLPYLAVFIKCFTQPPVMDAIIMLAWNREKLKEELSNIWQVFESDEQSL